MISDTRSLLLDSDFAKVWEKKQDYLAKKKKERFLHMKKSYT